MFRKIWKWFWHPSREYAWGAIFIVGGIAGILLTAGFVATINHSNTLEFCISCHEMRDTVYQEYMTSGHYVNHEGVRVVCSDCHIPKGFWRTLVRKIGATNEIYHKIVGSIDSPEKFAARRLILAKRVWARMEANDSLECRNCHSFEAMAMEKQGPIAAQAHAFAMESGGTCIDCHKGVAHNLPGDG